VLPGPLASGKNQEALRHLDGLLELGCTAFDTAAMYMGGGTERALGEWIRSRRVADRVTVITKGAHPNLVLGTSRVNPKAIAGDLHGSLRRLGLERIDLYLLHRDDPRVRRMFARFERHAVSPEHVAEAILMGVEKNRYMVFTSADGRLLHWIQRKFSPPYALAMRLAGRELDRVAD
jgi:aryl-alcohol dehydrogenase-like predicted oxidoreductase